MEAVELIYLGHDDLPAINEIDVTRVQVLDRAFKGRVGKRLEGKLEIVLGAKSPRWRCLGAHSHREQRSL